MVNFRHISVIFYGGLGNQVLSVALSQYYLTSIKYKKIDYIYVPTGLDEFKRNLQLPDIMKSAFNIRVASTIERHLLSVIQKFARFEDIHEYGVRIYTFLGRKFLIVNKFSLGALAKSLSESEVLEIFADYISSLPHPDLGTINHLCHYRNYIAENIADATKLQLNPSYFASVFKSLNLPESHVLYIASTHKCTRFEEDLSRQSIKYQWLTPNILNENALIKLGLESTVFIMSNSTLSWLIAALRTLSSTKSVNFFPNKESSDIIIWRQNFCHPSWISVNCD